jgi:hypothetical protein
MKAMIKDGNIVVPLIQIIADLISFGHESLVKYLTPEVRAKILYNAVMLEIGQQWTPSSWSSRSELTATTHSAMTELSFFSTLSVMMLLTLRLYTYLIWGLKRTVSLYPNHLVKLVPSPTCTQNTLRESHSGQSM